MSLMKSSLIAGGAMLAISAVALVIAPSIHWYNHAVKSKLSEIIGETGSRRDFVKLPLSEDEIRRYKEASGEFVKIEYDKFLNSTSIEPKPSFTINDDVDLNMSISYTNHENSKERCTLTWVRTSRDWRWLKFHDVAWLVDGDRWSSRGRFNSETYSGGVIELASADMTLRDFERIASSESASVRVGIDEFEISKEQKVMMHLLIYASLADRGFIIKEAATATAIGNKDLNTKNVPVAFLSSQIFDATTQQGRPAKAICINWKNDGNLPIHRVRADIRLMDRHGGQIEYRKGLLIYSNHEQGVAPGSQYAEPKDDAYWYIETTSTLDRVEVYNIRGTWMSNPDDRDPSA